MRFNAQVQGGKRSHIEEREMTQIQKFQDPLACWMSFCLLFDDVRPASNTRTLLAENSLQQSFSKGLGSYLLLLFLYSPTLFKLFYSVFRERRKRTIKHRKKPRKRKNETNGFFWRRNGPLPLLAVRTNGRHSRQWARLEFSEECWRRIHRQGNGSDETHRLVVFQHFQLCL
jgi:hypothetical protein